MWQHNNIMSETTGRDVTLTTRPNPFTFLPELDADTVRNIVLPNSTTSQDGNLIVG
jgi:hypothetical protein